MEDITELILTWTSCCTDVWLRWFKNIDNAEDEFIEVEEALFSALVLPALKLHERPSLSESYSFFQAEYKKDICDKRSICKRQKAGNLHCESSHMDILLGSRMSIINIDFMGTLIDEKPYAELIINDSQVLLEPLINLRILFTPTSRPYKKPATTN